MKRVIFGMICLIVLFTASQAVGLRCGNDLVDVGDAKIDVLRKCGEPLLVDEWDEEELLPRGGERIGEPRPRRAFVRVEQWTYNFGPTRFVYVIIFKKGKVAEIRTGDKGF